MTEKTFDESELAALAKKSREESGKTRSEAARDLKVSRVTVFNAEERPELSLFKVRKRIIETYSGWKLVGPEYRLEK